MMPTLISRNNREVTETEANACTPVAGVNLMHKLFFDVTFCALKTK